MSFTFAIYNNDLVINTTGSFLIVAGAQQVKQRVLIALQHYWQEYFLNRPDGVPYYELILGSKDHKTVEALFRDAILTVPGVISIIKFTVIKPTISNNRKYELYADIEVEGTSGTEIVDIVLSLQGV